MRIFRDKETEAIVSTLNDKVLDLEKAVKRAEALAVPTVELNVTKTANGYSVTGKVTGVRDKHQSGRALWGSVLRQVYSYADPKEPHTRTISATAKTEERAIAKAKKQVRDILTPKVTINRTENGSVCR